MQVHKPLAIAFALALVGATTAASCGSGVAPCKGDVCVTGTVRYFDLEGGFWAIRGDDSVTYDPMSTLPEAFRREGLRVQLDARERKDAASIHMVGPIVDVIAIRAIR